MFSLWLTSSLEQIDVSKRQHIYLLIPYLNWTNRFFFLTISCTHYITSFPTLLLIPPLAFSYISSTSSITTEPTPIFVLIQFIYLIHFMIMETGKLMFDWGGGGMKRLTIVVEITYWTVEWFLFCENNQKKDPDFEK